ncbi:unnamed protein product [Thelazia callipaeda]|uniref:HAP1 N-terminal domain-containing protein n=1 Tax=Thelazia callipaeda TaxID=103827 RepID=A0A0N5CRX4_THECL|nr:unnamed protein product [Thelazia callipaeda]
MSYSPPEKRRCVFNHKKNTDDTDDALLLSQVMDNEDWIYPTQLDRASVSLLKENKRSREPVNTLSLHDDVYEITDEVNRLRNQLGDSLDENQMLTYKIRNLSRENAVLQENLIRIHQTFEKKILEQRSDFEKAERSMRNIIVHQEQDLKTKDFRDRLNQLSLAESCSSEINKSNVGESQCSPSIRLKKVTLPNFQRHQHFPRNWFSNAPALRKIFDHRKSISDTFQVIDSQEKCELLLFFGKLSSIIS